MDKVDGDASNTNGNIANDGYGQEKITVIFC